ncbi:uncharacterized protein LOC106170158 [Lingula anatina]|uniref:Uncharacterized protein LOC106170158 n=1 Tax=Lingula anatina TaxID=7574 RepID=A0A1S3J4K3_LINAN|nr:uncharacterized protein LOC106170158 [Lingula anatina]|eukprot:XP_013405367.1 uncharacterized protein LOC106170158 [Lingula anatina]
MELDNLAEVKKKLNETYNYGVNVIDTDIKGNEEESEREPTWKSAFATFSTVTTFHGVGKIVEDTPFMLRRVIWIFLVLLGAGLFLMQLIGCVVYYRSWPVTVNVKINYADKINFPAVTICNLNAFKMSKAAENGHYEIINELYSSGLSGNHTDRTGNGTIEDLFQLNAHTKEDMILSCRWNNGICSNSDFEKIQTDHGICFTFNGGNKPVKTTAQTGAEHGLRLTINIEQYEYMSGPFGSAGLKVLLHEQHEVPLVRDLGQAIPPESHAFVGMSVIKVENLIPPHGKCGSRELRYYDYYSVPACDLDCEARHVVEQCGCRDFYMPEIYTGHPSVCNLSTYATCLRPSLETYERSAEACPCPVPCNRTLFDTTTTYATISNFNTETWLRSEGLQLLQKKYVKAREIRQKVDQAIRTDDEAKFKDLLEKYEDILRFFDNITIILKTVKSSISTMTEELKPRIAFHSNWGLESSVFTYHNDFIRGWNVMDERTFSHVTTGFFQTPDLFKHMMDCARSSDHNDTCFRPAVFHIVDMNLLTKLSLANRARANLTKVYEAYINGTPLLTFLRTPERHYDMTYVSLYLLHHDLKNTREHFEYIMRYLGLYIQSLHNLRLVAKQIFENGTHNETLYQTSIDTFISMSKKFLYQKYMIYDRIVAKPKEMLENIVQTFNAYNETLHTTMANVLWPIDQLLQDMSSLRKTAVKTLRQSIDKAQHYTKHDNITKTEVAVSFTSPAVEEELLNMQRFFGAARSRGRELLDSLHQYQFAHTAMWQNMMDEVILDNFYQKIHQDVRDIFSNTSDSAYLLDIVRRMLHYPRGSLDNISMPELQVLTNADFAEIDMQNKSAEIDIKLGRLIQQADLDMSLGNKDELFLSAFIKLQEQLGSFHRKNTIDATFFMENFLQLDVFLKELSYEEIKQQIAYDTNSLWSDIGGSLGLFVGASLITLLEFVDVIIHTLLLKRRIRNKKRH